MLEQTVNEMQEDLIKMRQVRGAWSLLGQASATQLPQEGRRGKMSQRAAPGDKWIKMRQWLSSSPISRQSSGWERCADPLPPPPPHSGVGAGDGLPEAA